MIFFHLYLKVKTNANIKIIECDILEVKADYIVHQCNALSKRSFGLASKIFKKWPQSNIYSGKNAVSGREPGTILARPVKNTTVINLIAQLSPGKPQKNDTFSNRLAWVEAGLRELAKCLKSNGETIAFPYGIGCGLAGGDWEQIFQVIQDFANLYPENTILICKKVN